MWVAGNFPFFIFIYFDTPFDTPRVSDSEPIHENV